MTPFDLMQSLKTYCEDITKNMILVARVEENGGEKAERPPRVFIGNLPDKQAERKEAPYILLKLLTGKDEDNENKCVVRIIAVTYSEDKQDCYLQCLNVVTQLRTRLLEDVVIADRYSCQKPIEYIFYDDDLEVYQVGELITTWEMPKIERSVQKWLG